MRAVRALGLAALALAWAAGQGEARGGEATLQVKSTVDEVLRILKDPALRGEARKAERRDRIRDVVLHRFGFEEMAKRSLGSTWRELSPVERKDFVTLYTELLERSYIARVERYSGQPIVYTGETVDGRIAEVRSTIPESLGDRTTIVYRLSRSDGQWQVYDLVIDGVSLVNNYRVQFGQTIRSSSYRGLVEKMRRKLASEEAADRPLPKAP